MEDGKQLIRSAGSVGANYIEANEALSKKDFLFRLKISRKEAKESIYWLRLITETNSQDYKKKGNQLIDEAIELTPLDIIEVFQVFKCCCMTYSLSRFEKFKSYLTG